jgi:hypothetical protein
MLHFKKFSFAKFVSGFTILALLSVMVAPTFAMAASITSAKAVFGRLKASTNADSLIITFASPTGIQAGTSDDIILTFSSDFTLAAENATNFDIGLGNSSTCSSATYTDEGVVTTAADSSNWSVDVTGNVITLEPDTDSALVAGRCVRVRMGTAAVTGGTGSASTIANGSSDDDDTIVVSGGFGDSGTMTVDIIDDDQVSVSASVAQSITFDLDTAVDFSSSEDAAPYAVGFGTISPSTVKHSDTSSVEMIVVEGGTNAAGGMAVTVANANGANGMVSTAVPTDKIPSATATMATATANYGLCVATSGLVGWTRESAYSTTCALASGTNDVVGLTSTPAAFLNSGAAPLDLATAHAEVVVNAEVSSLTPAHGDYTDTLTFIASGTF